MACGACLAKNVAQYLINNYFALSRSFVIFLYYLVGVLYYSDKEGWNVTDCIYFITVSTTTIGALS